jgi:hypothetical protein
MGRAIKIGWTNKRDGKRLRDKAKEDATITIEIQRKKRKDEREEWQRG